MPTRQRPWLQLLLNYILKSVDSVDSFKKQLKLFQLLIGFYAIFTSCCLDLIYTYLFVCLLFQHFIFLFLLLYLVVHHFVTAKPTRHTLNRLWLSADWGTSLGRGVVWKSVLLMLCQKMIICQNRCLYLNCCKLLVCL